jgi:hypothetical protein
VIYYKVPSLIINIHTRTNVMSNVEVADVLEILLSCIIRMWFIYGWSRLQFYMKATHPFFIRKSGSCVYICGKRIWCKIESSVCMGHKTRYFLM